MDGFASPRRTFLRLIAFGRLSILSMQFEWKRVAKKFYCLRSLLINTERYYLFIFKNYFDGYFVFRTDVLMQQKLPSLHNPSSCFIFSKFACFLPSFSSSSSIFFSVILFLVFFFALSFPLYFMTLFMLKLKCRIVTANEIVFWISFFTAGFVFRRREGKGESNIVKMTKGKLWPSPPSSAHAIKYKVS